MRPSSIVNFERLSLLAVAIGLVTLYLSWDSVLASARSAVPGTGLESAVAVLSLIYIGFLVLLILLTSRRGSAVAKWLFILVIVAEAVLTIPKLGAMMRGGAVSWLGLLQLLLQLGAIGLLFTAASRAWFLAWRSPATRPTP